MLLIKTLGGTLLTWLTKNLLGILFKPYLDSVGGRKLKADLGGFGIAWGGIPRHPLGPQRRVARHGVEHRHLALRRGDQRLQGVLIPDDMVSMGPTASVCRIAQ
jgi:hypothetical protein